MPPPEIEERLARLRDAFNTYLQEHLPREPREAFPRLEEYVMRGGKRYRPLLLLAAEGSISPRRVALRFAFLLELYHTFTLIHDDIEDGSLLRRGKPALHVTLGLPRALHLGDVLATFVWDELVRLVEEGFQREARLARRAFWEIMRGQAEELAWIAEDHMPSPAEYERMTAGKTGALLGAALSIGFSLKGADDTLIEEVFQAGVKLGIAFQIMDDYLNLFGTAAYGKTLGDDITEGKRTLLLIHALTSLAEREAERLREIIREHPRDAKRIREAIMLIEASGAPARAVERAQQLASEAKRVLTDPLLASLVDMAVQRHA